MTPRLRRALELALASLTAAGSLAAQQPATTAATPSSCPIETMQPQPIGIANLQRTKVINAKSDEEAQKALRDATKLLFDPKAASNSLGRDYLLAQFFALVMEHGGEMSTRGKLGLPGDANATVDLVVQLDSLLTIVEKGNAQCKKEVDEWRQYKPYMNNVQGAYKALGAGKFAEAESMAKRALILYKEGPQPYDVLWRTAKEKKDIDGEISNLTLAIEKLAGDTLNGNVRANLMFNLGREQQDAAQGSPEPKKGELLRGAAKAYIAVAREYPQSDEAPFALNGVSVASAILKDATGCQQVIDAVKSAVDKFSDIALAQAGVCATSVNKTLDAVIFFDAASKKNPYSRDYLYNLSAMLYEAHRPQQMPPVVKKLLELDPSNPDNVMLMAYAFKGFADSATIPLDRAKKDSTAKYAKALPADKKALRDSIAFYRAIQHPLIDSVTAYSDLADKMPHKLFFTSVDRLREKTLVEGEIENRGKTARVFTFELEFIGKDGVSLGKQTVTTESIAAGATGKFKAALDKGGALGVKYAALPLK